MNDAYSVIWLHALCSIGYSLGSFAQSKVIVGQTLSRAARAIIIRSFGNQVHRLVQYIFLHLIIHWPGLLAYSASTKQFAPNTGHAAAGHEQENGYDPHPHRFERGITSEIGGCMKNSPELMVPITFQWFILNRFNFSGQCSPVLAPCQPMHHTSTPAHPGALAMDEWNLMV